MERRCQVFVLLYLLPLVDRRKIDSLNYENSIPRTLRLSLRPEIPPLARADDTNAMTEPRREVPDVTDDEEIRGSIDRNVKKLSIGGIGQLDSCFDRVNTLAGLAGRRRRP
jgi:hypothetical protein